MLINQQLVNFFMKELSNCKRTLVVLDEKYAREFPRALDFYRLEDIVKLNEKEHSFLEGPNYEDAVGLDGTYAIDKIKESPIIEDLLVISLYSSHPTLLPDQNFPTDYRYWLSEDVKAALMNNQINFKAANE